MNTKAFLIISTVVAAGTLFAQDKPLPSSPRSNELFPELTRVSQTLSASASARALAAVRQDVAYAASPRVREEFQALDRTPVEVTGKRPVIENRALAASPRTREEFPWLARKTVEPAFEIAPVK